MLEIFTAVDNEVKFQFNVAQFPYFKLKSCKSPNVTADNISIFQVLVSSEINGVTCKF